MMKLQIEQIHPILTLRIRHEAMYPDQPYDTVKLPNDDEGIHFGLYADDQLSAVVSLFEQGDECQFRKLATVPKAQGKGLGRMLLSHIIDYERAHGTKRLWCDARLSAEGFYEKFGFQKTADTFSKNGYDFVIMDLEL